MADRIVVANYENMIRALLYCSKNICNEASSLQSSASKCYQALGERDNAVPEIIQRIGECIQKYGECADMAIDIADAMSEELEVIKKEAAVWGSDD